MWEGRERNKRVYDKRRASQCGRWRDREFAVLSDVASQTCPRAVQLVDFWVLSQFSHFEPFFEHITLVSYWDYGNIEDGRGGKWCSVPSTFQAPCKVLQTHCFILLILIITVWSRDRSLLERQIDMTRFENNARLLMKMSGNLTEPVPQWDMRQLK